VSAFAVTEAEPLVSVVIPCYNQAHYLEQAIASVLAQDYPRTELLVFDDGSTDATREVLAGYRGRFHTESHANCGQSATLNKGWRLARGEILAYLSADDFLLPGAVRTAVDRLRAHPEAVLAYCDFRVVDPDSRTVRHVRAPEYSYADMLVNQVCAPGPGAFFWRRAYEQAGPWDEQLRRTPDFEFWLRLGRQGTFVKVAEELAAYRTHDASQSFAPVSEACSEEMLWVVTRFFATRSLPPELAARREEAFANAHVVTAMWHLRGGRCGRAFSHLGQAVRIWPRVAWRAKSWARLANGLFYRFGNKIVWQMNRWQGGRLNPFTVFRRTAKRQD
jgi:glycosyltransferase involved in cell wall biosynthesis